MRETQERFLLILTERFSKIKHGMPKHVMLDFFIKSDAKKHAIPNGNLMANKSRIHSKIKNITLLQSYLSQIVFAQKQDLQMLRALPSDFVHTHSVLHGQSWHVICNNSWQKTSLI